MELGEDGPAESTTKPTRAWGTAGFPSAFYLTRAAVDLWVSLFEEAVEPVVNRGMLRVGRVIVVAFFVFSDVVQFQTAGAVLSPLSKTPITVTNAIAHAHRISNDLRKGRLLPAYGRILHSRLR